MNENIDILLKKYFDGETSLREENILKDYFQSAGVSAEHELYRPFFLTFKEEQKVVMHEAVKPVSSVSHKRPFRIITFAATAAAVLALIFVLPPLKQSKDTYAVINGEKITEEEFILQYAVAKLEKQFEIINKNLAPLENIHTIKNGVESGFSSLQSVKKTMGDIYEKLKFLCHEKDSVMFYMSDNDRDNG